MDRAGLDSVAAMVGCSKRYSAERVVGELLERERERRERRRERRRKRRRERERGRGGG